MKPTIHIVGNGSFGTFLRILFKGHARFDKNAKIVFLAVPASAYESVAKKYKGKHLVNVCSAQTDTNQICKKYSCSYTGIHPLFGARSPDTDRQCLVTFDNGTKYDYKIAFLLMNVGCSLISCSDIWHDQYIARMHAIAINIAEEAKKQLKEFENIADCFLPSSVKKLREVIYQLGDMTEGTRTSIM